MFACNQQDNTMRIYSCNHCDTISTAIMIVKLLLRKTSAIGNSAKCMFSQQLLVRATSHLVVPCFSCLLSLTVCCADNHLAEKPVNNVVLLKAPVANEHEYLGGRSFWHLQKLEFPPSHTSCSLGHVVSSVAVARACQLYLQLLRLPKAKCISDSNCPQPASLPDMSAVAGRHGA